MNGTSDVVGTKNSLLLDKYIIWYIEESQHKTVFVMFSLLLINPGNDWSNVLRFVQNYKIVFDMNHLSRISLHMYLNLLDIYHKLDRYHTTGILQQELIHLLSYLHHVDIFAVNCMFLIEYRSQICALLFCCQSLHLWGKI